MKSEKPGRGTPTTGKKDVEQDMRDAAEAARKMSERKGRPEPPEQ